MVTLTDRERAALDEIRAHLGLRSDTEAVLAGIFKLLQWIDPPYLDTDLFRLDRAQIRALTPARRLRRKAMT